MIVNVKYYEMNEKIHTKRQKIHESCVLIVKVSILQCFLRSSKMINIYYFAISYTSL